MKPPFEAYTGDKPYLFISYAHKDAKTVYPLISAWHAAGYRVWYDEGIDPGNEWPEEVAAALKACRQFIVFITPRAVASKNVKNEINYALNLDKDFIAVYLEETVLPSGLELRMGDIQAIMKYRMDDAMFENKMNKSLKKNLKRAKNEPVNPINEPEEEPEVSEKPLSERYGENPRIGLFVEIAKDAVNTIKDTVKESKNRSDLGNELKKKFEKKKIIYDEKGKKLEEEIKKQEKNAPVRRHVTVKKGVLSTLISLSITAGIAYFIYFYVVTRYSTLKKEYLKTECTAYISRDMKLAFIEKNESVTDEDLQMVQIEEELARCIKNTPEELTTKRLGIDTMSIVNLEKLYSERKDLINSWKKNLVQEYQVKYKESLDKGINSTNSEFMKRSVSDLYRTLLVELIKESYKEKR